MSVSTASAVRTLQRTHVRVRDRQVAPRRRPAGRDGTETGRPAPVRRGRCPVRPVIAAGGRSHARRERRLDRSWRPADVGRAASAAGAGDRQRQAQDDRMQAGPGRGARLGPADAADPAGGAGSAGRCLPRAGPGDPRDRRRRSLCGGPSRGVTGGRRGAGRQGQAGPRAARQRLGADRPGGAGVLRMGGVLRCRFGQAAGGRGRPAPAGVAARGRRHGAAGRGVPRPGGGRAGRRTRASGRVSAEPSDGPDRISRSSSASKLCATSRAPAVGHWWIGTAAPWACCTADRSGSTGDSTKRPEQVSQLGEPVFVLGDPRPEPVDHHAERLQGGPVRQPLGLHRLQRPLHAGDGEQRRLGDQHGAIGGGQRAAGQLARATAGSRPAPVPEPGSTLASAPASRNSVLEPGSGWLWFSVRSLPGRIRSVSPHADTRITLSMTLREGSSSTSATDQRRADRRGRSPPASGSGIDRGRGVHLRVEIDQQGVHPPMNCRRRKTQRDRGLSDAALEAQHTGNQHRPTVQAGCGHSGDGRCAPIRCCETVLPAIVGADSSATGSRDQSAR